MSWKNSLYSVLFVLSLSVFTQFICSSNVSAVSYSQTYTSDPSEWDPVVPSCTGDCLNTVSYLIIENPNPQFSSTGNRASFYIRFDGSFTNYLAFSCLSSSFCIYHLPFDGHANNLLDFYNYRSVTGWTFTLTDSYQTGIVPSGSLSITENGTFDVTNYAEAVVNVPTTTVAPYAGVLEGIKISILTCGAIIVVLYFFYCFYRIIIKTTGGK